MSYVESSRRICRFYETPEGCRRGSDCQFLHLADGEKISCVNFMLVHVCIKSFIENGHANLLHTEIRRCLIHRLISLTPLL